mmetsp:Transcript_33378/g.81933  ORF Transcript_33378/g.81933 Transcript_33378/m.81933 type:complete len:339 (-) Transcript_33378:508-1524(-)
MLSSPSSSSRCSRCSSSSRPSSQLKPSVPRHRRQLSRRLRPRTRSTRDLPAGPPPHKTTSSTHRPPPTDRKQRDALETIRRLAPYEGPDSEAYSSPFDFIQAIECIVYHQYADAHLRDEQVISQIASLLQYDALGWFNASFPSGSMALELRSWPLFRAAFLAEHVDQQQVYRAADDLVCTDRIRMLVPSVSVFALENYDRQFRRILNTLSTSATMGQPNASGPGPPNHKWTMLIYYSGLHSDLRTILAPERASLTTLAQCPSRSRSGCRHARRARPLYLRRRRVGHLAYPLPISQGPQLTGRATTCAPLAPPRGRRVRSCALTSFTSGRSTTRGSSAC